MFPLLADGALYGQGCLWLQGRGGPRGVRKCLLKSAGAGSGVLGTVVIPVALHIVNHVWEQLLLVAFPPWDGLCCAVLCS